MFGYRVFLLQYTQFFPEKLLIVNITVDDFFPCKYITKLVVCLATDGMIQEIRHAL
jgi:hypothetical protein